VRVLAGSYGGSTDPIAASAVHPVMLMHVCVAPGADGTLSGLPGDYNGFLWMLEGAIKAGSDDSAAEKGVSGLLHLVPGGDVLRIRNASADAPAYMCIGLGKPHRKPYYKYVGYGGGLVHRTVEGVEAAMAEYESDPMNYGRAMAPTAQPVDMSGFTLVSGFQNDDGDMFERPADAVARFKYVVHDGKEVYEDPHP